MTRLKLVPPRPEPSKEKEVGYENPVLQAKLEKVKREMGRKHCLHPKTTATLSKDVLGVWAAYRIRSKKSG